MEVILPSWSVFSHMTGQPVDSDGWLWVPGPWLLQVSRQTGLGEARHLTGLWAQSLLQSPCSLCLSCTHRALLRKLGGLFLPPEANLSLDSSDGILARAVVRAVSAPSGYVWGGPSVRGSASDLATLPLPF